MQLTSQPHQQQLVLSATNSFLHLSAIIDDRAAKKLAYITSWESAKKAEMEAELKKIEVARRTGLWQITITASLAGSSCCTDLFSWHAGATREEEGSVRREAEEQAGDASQDGRGEEGVDRGEARGGDHHGRGAGCQVPRQGRGSHEAVRPLESIRNMKGVTHDLWRRIYICWEVLPVDLVHGMFVVCECVLKASGMC